MKTSTNMKTTNFLFAILLSMVLTFSAQAEAKTGADYFEGKWTVLVKGLPTGDSKMIFILEKKDDKITGVVQDSTGTEISKLSSADVKEKEITLFFNAQGYDVNLYLARKDDDHTTGSLLGMFDAEGDRVKEAK